MSTSPGCLLTRSDSPVSSDSSTSMRPSPSIGPSTTTWSPGCSTQDVANDDERRVELQHVPAAHHVCLGPHEDRDAVHHALGAHLLDKADDRVDGDHEDHREGVQRLAEHEQEDAEEVEEVVDEVEDVVAHDAPVGASGADLDVVALAGGPAAAGLLVAEAGEGGRDTVFDGAHARTVSAPLRAVQRRDSRRLCPWSARLSERSVRAARGDWSRAASVLD